MKRIFTRVSVLAVLCLLAINVAFAQNITVKGKVTDGGDKSTIPSVSIVVKGTQTGTQTDASGAFSISAPANSTLVFTYVGYVTQEIPRDFNERNTFIFWKRIERVLRERFRHLSAFAKFGIK